MDGVFAPHLSVDCYNPKRLAESLGRADEPYIRDRARAILTKLVDDNIRNQQSLAIASELHGDPWATGCLDRLREAGRWRRGASGRSRRRARCCGPPRPPAGRVEAAGGGRTC